jgi:putative ABC transport system permease protein
MFELRMAWRETRGAWRHFAYFFVCIAVGVGALVAVGLFADQVNRAVTKEARGLLGGDIEIRSSHRLTDNGERLLVDLAQRGIATTRVSELVAMAVRPTAGAEMASQATQIVELKAVEEAYPLYGLLNLEPAQPLNRMLHPDRAACGTPACFGAVVQEALLLRMGLAVGDRLKIGQAVFLVTGIVRLEPDRMANAFSLGPRVIISRQGLEAADLIKRGSRVRERHLLKVPEGIALEPLRAELRTLLKAESVRVTGYRDAQPQLKQFLAQLSRYLGLVGLTALFIGGVGVAMSIRAFIREKLKTIAILKSLGAESSAVVRIYLLQALGLGLLGSMAGMAGGYVLQVLLPPLLTNAMAAEVLEQLGVSTGLSVGSIVPLIKGGLLGVLATVLFAAWPLLSIREIKPGVILRQEVETKPDTERSVRATGVLGWIKRERLKAVTAATLGTGLGGLAIWQAANWKVGLLFIGGLALAVSLLFLASRVALHWLTRLPRPRSVCLRYAVGNVTRPGGDSAGILIAIGLSVTIIVTVSLIEKALIREVGEARPDDAPTFFFIDIQPDQTEAFVRLVEGRTGGSRPELTPLVRSRIHRVGGETVRVDEEQEQDEERDESKEDRRRQWYVSREYALTYLERLPKGNEIVRGQWWTAGQDFPKPLVSVEEEAAKAMGLNIGSTVEFDIQGTSVAAEVSSIRKVDWGTFSTNFYMILSPGSLEGAPLTYVGTIHVDKGQEIPLQQAVVTAFPNVSAIHVGDVLDNFGRVLDRLSLAIRAVALFCLVSGALVMAAALATTRYRRLYEAVILKALGATRALLAGTFAVEYLLLGLVGGAVAVWLSSALSWLVLTYIFELSWSLHPGVLFLGVLLTMVLTLTVGFLSTFRILGERPLSILRHE